MNRKYQDFLHKLDGGFVMLKRYKVAAFGMVCALAAVAGQSVVPQEKTKETDSNCTETVMFEDLNKIEAATAEEVILEKEAVTKQRVFINESDVKTMEFSTEAQPEIQKEIVEASELDGYVIPTVDEYLNIRSTPSTDSEIVGKLYVGTKAEILGEEGDWYRIQSGSVEGYVYKSYTLTGKEAEAFAVENGYIVCNVLTGGLRVRENPGTDADVLDIAGEGEKFDIVEMVDGWVAVAFEGETAYLSSDYVSVDYVLGEAISIEEELAAIRAAEEERARQEKARQEESARQEQAKQQAAASAVANSKVMQTVQRDSIAASDEDIYLLACLVHMEAGWEPYEGQLAVANVVLNRLRAGYGSNISEVIYAKGQFSGANSGALARILASGPNQSCITAAVEAFSGVNNIGDYRHFISARYAKTGSYSEYTLIGNHCFYKN